MILATLTEDDAVLALISENAMPRGLVLRRFTSLQDAVASKVALAIADWPVNRDASDFIAGLQMAQTDREQVPVIVILPMALRRMLPRALASGASGVVLSPVDRDELKEEIDEALGLSHSLTVENRIAFDELIAKDLVGQSPAIRRCFVELQRAAASEANVLLLGETGTGKERFARAIHMLSRRASFPYVAQDAASIPAALLESELFGFVKGAFTGADTKREGRLSSVRTGSLLLDEVGDMEMPLQGKLLRVLESREFYPLGSDKLQEFNGRVIAATSTDLDKAVMSGKFRLDLLSRLDQFRIALPPLRERREDIPILAQRFLEKHSLGRPISLSASALDILVTFEFPRNVRQLENAIIGAVARLNIGTTILPKHLPAEILQGNIGGTEEPTINAQVNISEYESAREKAVREIDRLYLSELLRVNNNNVSAAADSANIDRKTFAARWKNAQ